MEWIGCGTRGNHHAEGKSRRDSRAGVTMLSRVPSFILLLCKSNKKREERGTRHEDAPRLVKKPRRETYPIYYVVAA